jgi:hypothetical protein
MTFVSYFFRHRPPEIRALGIDDLIAMEIATREMLLDPILPAKARW